MNEKRTIMTEEQEKRILDPGEEILWRSEKVGMSCSKVILHSLFVLFILVPFVGLTSSFIVSNVFFSNNLNILIKIVSGILLTSSFFYILIWLTRYIFHNAFYISNKRLILLEPTQKYGFGFLLGSEPTYSDINDIEYLKSLSEKNGDYSKFLLKTNFYKYFLGIRSPKLWKTYRYVWLDGSAFEVLNKLIKEK